MRERIEVGQFVIDDVTYVEVIETLAMAVTTADARRSPYFAYALHVNGLLHAGDNSFVDAMRHAQVVYADGMSVVLLARAFGATVVERCATTDLGHSLIEAANMKLGRSLKIALVGGEPGVAERAAEALEREHSIDVVHTSDGFKSDWTNTCAVLAAVTPDIIFVGMGVPREMLWCAANAADLPPSVTVTCGGWFGFLGGAEKRAPLLVQRVGFEWVWRLAKAPRSLAGRYLRGGVLVAKLLVRSRTHARSH